MASSSLSRASATALPALGLTNSMNFGLEVATFTRPAKRARSAGSTACTRSAVSMASILGVSKASQPDSFSPTASSRTGQFRKA